MKLLEFLKNSLKTAWEGMLNNTGVLISAFIVSGGYLVAINKIKELQAWVREIPTDYVLTPLVLLIIAIAVLLRINKQQIDELSKLQEVPMRDEADARFVTHLGVWWKVYLESEYIEDFPYCSCCEPRLKLVQTDWYPDEVFKCSKTDTEYKLYEGVPRKKDDILDSLYTSYFKGFASQFQREFYGEYHRLKELQPDIPEKELCLPLFNLKPLCDIPKDEVEKILEKHKHPVNAYNFVEKNYRHYKQYFKSWADRSSDESPNK